MTLVTTTWHHDGISTTFLRDKNEDSCCMLCMPCNNRKCRSLVLSHWSNSEFCYMPILGCCIPSIFLNALPWIIYDDCYLHLLLCYGMAAKLWMNKCRQPWIRSVNGKLIDAGQEEKMDWDQWIYLSHVYWKTPLFWCGWIWNCSL